MKRDKHVTDEQAAARCTNPLCVGGWVAFGNNESGGAPAIPCQVCRVHLPAPVVIPDMSADVQAAVLYRIQVSGGNVTAVRERIERRLCVETTARPEGHVWGIYFEAPSAVSFDFLCPDVLPPKHYVVPFDLVEAARRALAGLGGN